MGKTFAEMMKIKEEVELEEHRSKDPLKEKEY